MDEGATTTRMQPTTAKEFREMAGKLKKAIPKLEAFATALEMNAEAGDDPTSYVADGKVMAFKGVQRIVNFIKNCEKIEGG
jgi:hypothetical protein